MHDTNKEDFVQEYCNERERERERLLQQSREIELKSTQTKDGNLSAGMSKQKSIGGLWGGGR